MAKYLIILISVMLFSACKGRGLEKVNRVESSLKNDFFASSFSFYSEMVKNEENLLYKIKILLAKDFFQKDSNIKFIVEKDIRCHGNASIQLYLEPSISDSIWSGNLTIELLGVNSSILSRKIQNRIKGIESKEGVLYYTEALRKSGSSFAITYNIKVIKDTSGMIREVDIVQLPEGLNLRNSSPIHVGRLGNLFIGNKSFHDVYLYYHMDPAGEM